MKLAINKVGTAANTKVIHIEATATHLDRTSDFTNNKGMNEDMLSTQIESLFCRLVDLLSDTIYKFTIMAIEELTHTDPRLTSSITNRGQNRINSSHNPDEEMHSFFKETFGYQLTQTRKTARDLGFTLDDNLEAVIQTRNCIVHQNGLASADLQNLLNQTNEFAPDLDSSDVIRPNWKMMQQAIKLTREYIKEAEDTLHDDFNIPWDYMEVGKRDMKKIKMKY
ncbi:MAG: hypothetical protein ACSHYA_18335 [Opitutaceae bacterium]